MHVCHNHMSACPALQPLTKSPLFSLNLTLSPFPPLFFITCHASPCACTEYRTVYTSLYLPHMYMQPPWRAIRERDSDLVCISQQGRQTSFGLFVNVWNEIRCRGRLSQKIGITQPCARINLGYILLSYRSRSVSIPNCIQSLLNKNKGLFSSH